MLRILLLIVITAIWGISYVIVKESIEEVHYNIFQFWRYLTATLVMFILFYKKIFSINNKLFFKGLIVVGVPTFLAAWFAIIGMNLTTASQTAFFCGLSVVMIPIIIFLHTRKKPNKYQLIGIVFSFLGVLFITNPFEEKIHLGILFLILSAISYGYQYINVGSYVVKTNPYTTTFIQCFAVFIGFVLLMLFDISLGEYSLQSVYELSSKEIFSIMFVGIVVGALIWLGISYIQKDVNPITVGIVLATEPFFTLIFEWLVSARVFKTYELIGGLFIILATIVIAIDDNSKNKNNDDE